MSGTSDRELLAAEYVLGLLDAAQARQVADTITRDSALAASVDAWTARLEPLAALAAPMEPSEALWQRIAQDLPPRRQIPAADPPARFAPYRRPPGRLIGRAVGFAGYGLAAALAAIMLLSRHHLDIRIAWDPPVAAPSALPAPPASPRPPPAAVPPIIAPAPPAPDRVAAAPPAPARGAAVALLTAAGADHPAMKAFFVQGGSVRLVAMQPVSVPGDRQLGFWVWPRGTALPTLLGRVDATGGTLPFPYHEADGTPVMVTLEPRQLPTAADAQGPTLFTGQFVALD